MTETVDHPAQQVGTDAHLEGVPQREDRVADAQAAHRPERHAGHRTAGHRDDLGDELVGAQAHQLANRGRQAFDVDDEADDGADPPGRNRTGSTDRSLQSRLHERAHPRATARARARADATRASTVAPSCSAMASPLASDGSEMKSTR